MYWHRNLCSTTISGSDSDRVCGIRIKIKNSQQFLSVISVYLPCADLGADYYLECIVELERITEESKQLGPTIIMGDFNAHLGTLGGPRGRGDPNSQGVLLHELLQRCDLFAASLSNHAEGPDYTFWRGDTRTTVDYVLMDIDAASIMSSCVVQEEACLNTSDHLLGLGELCSKTLLLCYAPMLSNALIMLLRIVIMLTVCSLYNIIHDMWSRGGEVPRVTK